MKKERGKKEKIIKKIFVGGIFLILISVGIGVYQENQIQFLQEDENRTEVTLEKTLDEMTQKEIKKETEKIQISQEYLGFEVDAQLMIPKINLETYILKEYTEEGMKLCAAKFWGPEPNEIGNFCIAGHNYNKENMFNHLIDLEIGDELYLIDSQNGKYEYEIYDIYKVKPQNIAPLNQETNGKRVITLITCVNYSKNRLIVQAVERQKIS